MLDGNKNSIPMSMSRRLLCMYREWFSEEFGRCDVLVTEEAVLENNLEMITNKSGVLLNIGSDAVVDFSEDDDCIAFTARFNKVPHHIVLHYSDIIGVRNPETMEIIPINCLPVLLKEGGAGLLMAQQYGSIDPKNFNTKRDESSANLLGQ